MRGDAAILHLQLKAVLPNGELSLTAPLHWQWIRLERKKLSRLQFVVWDVGKILVRFEMVIIG